MKVWLVNWHANRSGGAAVYAENLALGLAARGHRVVVVCYDAFPRVEAACHVVRVPQPRHARWPVLWRAAPALVGPHWAWHLARVRDPEPDVVVFSPAVCQRALAQRFPRVPRVYLPHARVAPLEVADGLRPGFFRWLAYRTHYRAERQSLLRSAATVRFTPSQAELHTQFYRLPPWVRFEVIPQAVDVPTGDPPSRSGPTRVLAMGRLIPSKNIRLLIESLQTAPAGAWHLDVVGDGSERPALEAAVRAAGLSERVTFHGQQDDPGRFYERADLLAFPSRLENVSLVVLEAMANGMPALVIRADGVNYQNVHHEVIRNGVDGFVAADEAEFGRMLREFLADPDRVRRLGPAARFAAAAHSWPVALDRWERLLIELTSEQRAQPQP